MQLELDVRRYHRNLGFALVLALHGLVAWGLLNSKIRLPIPQAVDSTVLALIARPPAMQTQAGSSGVPAMSGSVVPDVPVTVDFVPVSVEEAARAYAQPSSAEYRQTTVAPVAAPLPMAMPRDEQPEKQMAAAVPNSAAAAGGGARAISGNKAGTDEIDYESLPAAMLAIDCESPPYPGEAIEKAQAGTVRLALLIDAQGRVVESRVVRSSKSPVLDRASRDAIANCQFIPAARNGVSAQGWVILNYIWTLHLKPGVIR
jgi:TonB family protein